MAIGHWSFAANAAEVARVGNESISVELIRQTIARHGYNIYEQASAKKALEDVIRFELLAAEAQRLGYDKDPAIARQIKELMVQKLVAERIDGPLKQQTFTDDDLKAYYEAHPDEFAKPGAARGGVLTIFATAGQEEAARNKAGDALTHLKSGEKFEQVVKKFSDDPSERITGGVSNWMMENQESKRYPKEVVQTMFALKSAGELSGPIQTDKAWYFVTLAEKRPSQTTPFEQARSDIRTRLIRSKREQIYNNYSEELKQAFPVSVNEAELKKAVEPSQPNSGPPRGPVNVP